MPTHYYRIAVAFRPGPQELEALAFLVPNRPTEERLESFLTSIDEIERLSGIDFLGELDDGVEEVLESARAPRIWPEN